MTSAHDPLTSAVLEHLHHDRPAEAIELILQRLGGELYGYVLGITRDPDVAADAFQTFSLRAWKSLPSYRQEGSLRGWLYTVARNAAYRTLEDTHRRRADAFGTGEQEQLPAKWTRTATAQWQKTSEKNRLWSVIDTFPPEDREVLILRLGRKMTWNQIAEIIEPCDDKIQQRRYAATLRKKFERLKKKLRKALG